MSVKINYKNNLNRTRISNAILFTDEKFNISPLKRHISNKEYHFISDLLKSRDLKKKIIPIDFSFKRKKYF